MQFGHTASGSPALIIGGHAIPLYAAGGVGVAVVLLLVMRAKKKHSNVVSAGQAAAAVGNATPYDPSASAGVDPLLSGHTPTNQDYFDLQSMVSQLQNELSATNAAGAVGAASGAPSGGAAAGTAAATLTTPAQELISAYETDLGRMPTLQELAWRLGLLGTNPLAAQLQDLADSPEAAAYDLQLAEHPGSTTYNPSGGSAPTVSGGPNRRPYAASTTAVVTQTPSDYHSIMPDATASPVQGKRAA